MQIQLKPVEFDDIALLDSWYKPQSLIHATGGRTLLEALPDFLSLKPGFFIITLNCHRSIGFVVADLKDTQSEKILWIRTLIIEPSLQKSGYGTAALRALLNYVGFGEKVRKVLVSVHRDNIAGYSFWVKNGFRDQTFAGKLTGMKHVRILIREAGV